jgi:hypothetical protein
VSKEVSTQRPVEQTVGGETLEELVGFEFGDAAMGGAAEFTV